ncbi:hypothetical protein EON63_19810 [archaeon]|nr:MAG: hypothetical protein EON63_19810 [archaeon]
MNEAHLQHTNTYLLKHTQVRHPIRVITTLVNKCADFDRIWFWIASTSGFESIRRTQTPLV